MTLPDATVITYTLDNANRLKSAKRGSSDILFSQAYDSRGNRKKLLRGGVIADTEYNDLACVTATSATCYSYDAFGRLLTMGHDLDLTANDITWSFTTRNPANQILKWDASSANYDYTETVATTVPQTYNGLNQDAGIASMSDGYDARGNLTHVAPATGARYFAYDLENRLLSKKTTSTGSDDLTLTYDTEGRLSSYKAGGVETEFLYDGTILIGEYKHVGTAGVHTSDTMQAVYIHGTGVDEPLVWFNGSGYGSSIKRFFVSNYQGSIIGYTDATGALQATYKYDAYGRPMNASNAEDWSGARFRYTGQTMLYEARLYYYKARVYDPVYGHFMQTDPIGSKDDLDLYAYVGGDPVNSSDPTGLQNTGRSEDFTQSGVGYRLMGGDGALSKAEKKPEQKGDKSRSHGGGWGWTFGAQAELGAAPLRKIMAGGAAQVSVAAVTLHDNNGNVTDKVISASAGAFAYAYNKNTGETEIFQPSKVSGGDNQKLMAANAGFGGGAVFTNAETANDLRGTATTYTATTPIFGIQYSESSSGIFTLSLTAGKGVGWGISEQTTNTLVCGKDGCF